MYNIVRIKSVSYFWKVQQACSKSSSKAAGISLYNGAFAESALDALNIMWLMGIWERGSGKLK
jgi:hypothetical protein